MKMHPVLIAAAAGAALLLMTRNASAGTTGTRGPLLGGLIPARPGGARIGSNLAARRPIAPAGGIGRTMTYANAQNMGELLARTVNIGRGIFSDVPRTVDAVIGTTEARDALRQSEAGGYYGWSGPTVTPVDPGISALYAGDPYHGGALVDSIPAGPVYDVGADSSPWAWAEEW